jgi:sporulation protein YlmC with PRC-barrel domain
LNSKDNVIFTDGYDFRGADFNADSVVKEPNKYHLIRLRIIDNLDLLDKVYRATNSTIEIYQFYNNKVYYENSNHKHVKIPFENINDITDMI